MPRHHHRLRRGRPCLSGLELCGSVRVQLECVTLRREGGGETTTRGEQLGVLGVELLRRAEREREREREMQWAGKGRRRKKREDKGKSATEVRMRMNVHFSH